MAGIPRPIAVIGIGCRFPGGANSPEKLWEVLCEGRDTWSEVPEGRFKWKSFHHPDPEAPGAHNHRGGHFLDEDIAAFDGRFFGIPPQECEALDPQFRIQLEVTYEAIENAGLHLEHLRGSETAVYVATFGQDYAGMQDRDLDTISKYYMTGRGLAMASNRISYAFDLRGPSVTLDTGCSGSMVAIHQACQSLRVGEAKIALAGGVSLIITPDLMVPMSSIGVLNKDGKSYSFDSRGAGYGRGEGAAMIVLKNLDDAIRDGDNIRGIIRNSGVGQDGKTPGITVPNREAQLNLIQSVYRQANLNPHETKYVEAHGTGTIAGDGAEIAAIRGAFATDDSTPVHVGSAKPNVGHMESASGVAGLIKAILMLENGAIPPSINLVELKESIQGSDISIPVTLEPWDKTALRRISVNSFGYGGTNGHVILDSASTVAHQTNEPVRSLYHEEPCLQVLVLTAKSEESLVKALENFRQWLSQNCDLGGDAFRNLAYTLSTRRSLFRWRCSFTGTSPKDVLSHLSLKSPKPTRSVNKTHNVFVFTGQGAQWFAMGRELLGFDSLYLKSLRASDKILKELGASWSLITELSRDVSSSRVNESQIAQPATTALQIALVDLLSSTNVHPDVVIGHSSGEIAAAYAAGALGQKSALKVAYYRGLLQVTGSVKGAMLAVGLGEKSVSQYMSQVTSGKLVVACSNSPESSTVSGDEAAILELKGILDTASVFARKLAVDTAYHSHHVKSVAEEYLHSLAGLEHTSTTSVRLISSVTGKEMTSGFGADYWVDNLVSKVRFQAGLEEVCRKTSLVSPQGGLTFIEIGPHNALSGPLRQTMSSLPLSTGYSSVSVLARNKDARYTLLEILGKLFERGSSVDINFANLLFEPNLHQKLLSNLPSYSWDHSVTHWRESRLSKAHRFRRYPHHDLLGSRIPNSTSLNPAWLHNIGVDQLPWLQEHVIDGFTIFPASGYISMAIEAMLQSSFEKHGSVNILSYDFKDIKFPAALLIPESPACVEIQLSLNTMDSLQDNQKSKWEEFKVVSVSAQGTSIEHCHGSIMVHFSTELDEVEGAREQELNSSTQVTRLGELKSICNEELDHSEFYQGLKSRGNSYGPNFACINKISLGGTNAVSVMSIPDTSQCMPARFQQPHIIHPSTLDALMHHPVTIFNRNTKASSFMIFGVDELKISSRLANEPGTTLTLATTTAGCGSRFPSADVSAFQTGSDPCSGPVIQMKNLKLHATGDSGENMPDEDWERNISYTMKWDLDADHMASSMFIPGPDSFEADRAQEHKLELLNQAAAIYVALLTVNGPPKLPGQFPHLFKWMNRFQQSEECKSLLQGVSDTNVESILENAQKLEVEGELLGRVGPELEAILTGKADALSLMTENNLLYRLYSDDASSRCYSHVHAYVKQLVFKNPKMRVIELGGGTGSTTSPLLEALSPNGVLPFEKYVFTDVSSGFFERTRERLKMWDSGIEYKKLDLNVALSEQGFEEESYDLVIAGNCLHVASSMDNVMSSVRKLLKPGGRVVMIETTRVVPFYNTFLGVFDGWWAGIEDGRVDSPTLTVGEWHSTLLRNGFNGVEIVANDFEGKAQRSAMMVSKASDRTEDGGIKANTTLELVLGPSWTAQPPQFAFDLSSGFSQHGFHVSMEGLLTAQFRDDIIYVILDNGSDPILTTDASPVFEQVKSLLVNANRVLWISIQGNRLANLNPEKGMIAGLARVSRAENPFLHIVTMDVQESVFENPDRFIRTIREVVNNDFLHISNSSTKELEYVYRNQKVLIPRLVPSAKLNDRVQQASGRVTLKNQLFHQPNRPLKLHVQKPGFLDSLSFIEDNLFEEPLPASHIEVQVETCGLNFKDVLIALGQINKQIPMAAEFAGVITKVGSQHQKSFRIGDRVCGIGGSPYASTIRLHGHRASHIPPSMSFEVAASIPVVFATAYHALVDIANLQQSQTVLIHSAAGGVGQAALQIAQNIGAEVFATVGNAAKRQLLVKEFGIPEDHIFSSKLRTFKKGIHRLTNAKGVDVVLNSLSGEALQESWASIARFGVFVELGKADSLSNTGLTMAPFDRNVTFASVDLQLICDYRPEKVASLLKTVLNLFSAGTYHQINPITVIPITNIEEAFRIVQAREHVGKIILGADSNTLVKAPAVTTDDLIISQKGTYLIAGGLGGLGLEIARMIATHGARHIALLSRRHLSSSELLALEEEFEPLGAKVIVLTCDITDLSKLRDSVSSFGSDMPPVKGVIQASMVLQDCVLSKMDIEDFKLATAPKCTGTANLVKALDGQPLEFFLMLASIASVVGSISQANYAAGNNYMDTLAQNNSVTKASNTHFVSVDFGPIDDAGTIANSQRTKDGLIRQGYILLKLKQVLALISYAISRSAREDKNNQIILGVDHKSIVESDNEYTLKNPMFSHLSRVQGGQSVKEDGSPVQTIENLIASTQNIAKIELLISEEIARKISKLVAMDYEEIELERRMAEFGLDSLVSIELKNWITQTFKAKLQASEIADAAHILALGSIVASRSAFISNESPKMMKSGNGDHSTNLSQNTTVAVKGNSGNTITLPKQPLPDLDHSLDQFLDCLLPVFTPKEYLIYEGYVNDLRKPGGFGRKLQARLSQLFHDPQVDNYLSGFYAPNMFLKNRQALVPWLNFFATHFMSPVPHTAAQRAAIISASAFQFKQKLESGEVGHEYLNEQPISTEAYKWYFNATREPGNSKDAMKKYPGNDYLVAFRRGHAYKISLRNGDGATSYTALLDAFQRILDADEKPESWVGVLTQDTRDHWADTRTELQNLSKENRAWIHDIEASAFVVYLDEARPQTASERGPHFLHANGRNRWSDKTTQFAICDNGISATIGEHTMFDGYTFIRLYDFVCNAILTFNPQDPPRPVRELPSAINMSEGYTFTTSLAIEKHITRIRAQLTSDAAKFEYRAFEIPTINRNLFSLHKCPPNSGVQLAIQLAARRYWGHNPISLEPISQNHFRNGRIDLNLTVRPPIAAFCAAAADRQPPTAEVRKLFFDAARTHASNVATVSRGHSFDRHFFALQSAVRDGETMPALFTDPLYRSRKLPPQLMTNCLAAGALEGGDVFDHPNGMSINFQTEEKFVKVSIWGRVGTVDEFREILEESARDIKAIVEM
ncbi:Highly reducing polyketide synthase [Lachnellula willkommii]|uniref:Highly reducing polyketide synthase n=1 Tax=Lachnellula willkommii TaxID=215461 RepID=A0A559MJY7_9HELO|nr:Highly reducing polyketide synthase [Lachnellula willkommii]